MQRPERFLTPAIGIKMSKSYTQMDLNSISHLLQILYYDQSHFYNTIKTGYHFEIFFSFFFQCLSVCFLFFVFVFVFFGGKHSFSSLFRSAFSTLFSDLG